MALTPPPQSPPDDPEPAGKRWRAILGWLFVTGVLVIGLLAFARLARATIEVPLR
jgi:hypothetical protein